MKKVAKKVSKHLPAKRKPKAKAKKLDPKKDFENPVKKAPRQARLPGQEDNAIQDLEDAALEHSELRTEAAATRADFKERLKSSEDALAKLMKANGKTTYNHTGIRLKLREGKDTVSVQVKRHDRQDQPPAHSDGQTASVSDDGPVF